MRRTSLIAALTISQLGAACSAPVRPAPPPLPPPSFAATAREPAREPGSAGPAPARAEVLVGATVDELVQRALANHPDLAAARARVEAAGGRVQQAGRWPNPEAQIALEEAPLEGGNALEDADVLIGISQSIPLSDRLESATRAESAERVARERELEARTVQIRRAVRGAFAGALYAQEVVALHEVLVEATERRADLLARRVDAGDETESALMRVELEEVAAKHELQRARTAAERARLALSTAVASPDLAFEQLGGELGAAFELPSLDNLLSRLADNPALLAASAGSDAARARFDLARDLASPDLDLELLYRRTGPGTNALDLGVSIPMPIFDRGRGRITEARAGILEAQANERSARIALEAGLRDAWATARASRDHLRLLEEDVLPRAARLAEQAELHYDVGDIRLDELLRLRAQWAAVRLGHLQALHETMLAWVELTAYLSDAP